MSTQILPLSINYLYTQSVCEQLRTEIVWISHVYLTLAIKKRNRREKIPDLYFSHPLDHQACVRKLRDMSKCHIKSGFKASEVVWNLRSARRIWCQCCDLWKAFLVIAPTATPNRTSPVIPVSMQVVENVCNSSLW